jgi:flagellar hook-length control protein FliK
MRVHLKGRPQRGAACVILQLQCCTHRVTDSASMPALSTLSLLSTAASSLVNVAGQVADALHNTKSGSDKKTDSPNQAQNANQLAAVFAAYLAAAAHSTAGSVPAVTSVSTQSAGTSVTKGQSKSTKDGSLSILPLSVMLAAGPTTAITAAMALRSATGGGITSAPKTGQKGSLVPGTVPTVPTAKPSTPAGVKTPSPTKGTRNVQAASASERMTTVSTKRAQTTQTGGHPSSVSSQVTALSSSLQGTPPASNQATTAEIPVLALHDVPAPSVQDSTHRAAVPDAALSDERSASTDLSSTRQPIDTGHSSGEVLPVSAIALQGQMTQTKIVAWTQTAGETPSIVPASGDSSHSSVRDASQPRTASPQAASSSPAIPPAIAAASVGPLAGNTTDAASNNAQTNVPVADGRTDFHLRLEPPQLGSVQIHLTATNHNTVSARVVVSQEGTQQLIAGQEHQLRQSLADSGVVLGTFDVTHSGGGSTQGGHHQPPEPPPSTANISTQSVGTRVTQSMGTGALQTVPTDGINILA